MRLTKRASKRATAILATCALFGALMACGDDYNDERARLLRAAAAHQVGTAPDYVLTKYNFGIPDPVGIIFGMMDDYQFCSELAEVYTKRYPADTYVCLPVKGYPIP